jgi:hypothetical protein
MPYVFVTSYLPYHRTAEIAKIYVDTLRDYNSDARPLRKEVVPNSVIARKDHIEVVSVHDVDEANLAKFIQIQQKWMTQYHGIEGHSYTIEVRFKVTEALEMIGMKMPE